MMMCSNLRLDDAAENLQCGNVTGMTQPIECIGGHAIIVILHGWFIRPAQASQLLESSAAGGRLPCAQKC